MQASRISFLAGAVTLTFTPIAALADRQADKNKFLAQCDESISIERLAGAPHKFIGKKVDIHGIVGPAMNNTSAFNLDSANEPGIFVIVAGDARTLEQNQPVRVLGIVIEPVSGGNNMGGSGTYAVVRARFVS